MWIAALEKLSDEATRATGVREMGRLREAAMDMIINRGNTADVLIRAARHFEGGAQRLILEATSTCRQFIIASTTATTTSAGSPGLPPKALEPGQVVTASCPSRIDLAGGWTDTPPIAFENGGAVTNLALQIDGERPVGASAKVLADPVLVLVTVADGGEERRTV